MVETSLSLRNKKIINKPLSEAEFKDLVKVADDPFYFSQFIYVIHAVRGKTQFKLYPYQRAVLWNFINNRFNIILKFRQAGITELIAMFCLWFAMYHPNKNVNIISIKDVVAKKVLRKIKYMYRNLPPHLQVQVINGRSADLGTGSEIMFANGSIITSIPTTEEAGRSEALSLLVIDEAAIIRWAETIWAAALPTLSTGGRAILNSTPYGIGNFFHKQWVKATAGGSEFVPIRLKWPMHPERNMAWYNQMAKELGPRRTAQEIDGDFLTSGASVFDLTDIRAIEESIGDYTRLDYRTDSMFASLCKTDKIRPLFDNLLIFDKPHPNKRYTIGADVATGRARDYSAGSVMSEDGEEAACFKAKIPIDELSYLLGELGQIYHRATLAPESNDIGLGVASKLENEGYGRNNLFYSVRLLKEKGKAKPKEEKIAGWYTTPKNRPVIIGGLEEDIRRDTVTIKDPFFCQEAYTFVYNDQNKPTALGKEGSNDSESSESLFEDEDYTDDAILGKAITNHVRKVKQRGLIILPA